MERGYVCLWRKLKDSDVMKHADVLQVFIALLLESSDDPTKKITMELEVITLEPGEVYINYENFSSKIGLSVSHLLMVIDVLVAMGIIAHIPAIIDDTQPDLSDEAIILIKRWRMYQPPRMPHEYLDSLTQEEVPRNDQ